MLQTSIVFVILDGTELEFMKKIGEFAQKYQAEKGSEFPKIVGTHIKLLEER